MDCTCFAFSPCKFFYYF
ncbi:unnamed protein product [Acanthoscelides obtectus]|uniref:Uncharacterized protein n=1 Tax=Acanthoscelides obtectus TaxID=200917 RepID=A0A9P0K6J3_ACAOB|nr:unnamed protein product [Acanthoscelides obtectus]CAK1662508.1 hypothetical protein AOBTE_LOCUS23185 [Acanthoscelides obtectus]